jgi:uncharacterized HhH-GPD family protein
MDNLTAPLIRLVSMTALGSFSWRWPDQVETFERGWVAAATVDGQEVQVRHGIGRRDAYGRSRRRSVTWVEGEPTVEGVEADDFNRSESLLSLIKVTKRHVRPGDALPPGYRSFSIVVMADEAAGPRSPRSLAVKLRQDDIDGWTRHAVLRAAARGRLPVRRQERTSLPPLTSAGPAPATVRSKDIADIRVPVVAALLAYEAGQPPTPQGGSLEFTPNQDANALLRTDPFAFLAGVLFDQQVPAERAWLAPYLLRERLGHLDPERIAREEESVRAAVQSPPKLHRYVAKMPGWLVLAARRVISEYHGDAAAIWSDQPSADELQRRFGAFAGIGQKKAAMAVEMALLR